MPRYFRGRQALRIRPVQTRKEILDSTLLGVSGGTTSTVTLVTAVDNYAGVVNTVPTGSVVKGVYLFIQIVPNGSSANVDWYLWKNPSGLSTVGPTPGAVGGDPRRKYVLHEEKGIPGSTVEGQGPLTFRGVIKIPRGLQRFGEDDTLQLKLRGAQIYDACIKAIYKVYL